MDLRLIRQFGSIKGGIYAKVCANDEAIGLFEDLVAKPTELGMDALRLDPAWKPLRDHPRCQALLQKYGS